MPSERSRFIALNVVGGLLVLGSYAACIEGWPEQSKKLWGAIPEAVIPYYTLNMFVAATGYFLFSWRALAASGSSSTFVGGRSFSFLLAAYAATLLGSALWMPLSLYAVIHGAEWMYWIIVADLGVVAGGSLSILLCMVTMAPTGPSKTRIASITGACMFCSQTVLLDFAVWPWFFSIASP